MLTLLGSLIPSPIHAALRPNSEGIVGPTTLTVLNGLPVAGLDVPASLATDRDVYVIIRAGAGYVDYQVLGRAAVPPERLAAALEAGLQGSPMDGRDVEYGRAEGYSAATNAENRVSARLWARSASNAVPAGAIARAFRSAGFQPHVLFWAPRYTESPGLGPAPHLTRTGRWYDGAHLPEGPVIVRAALPPSTAPVAIAFLLWVPFWTFAGILTGVMVARNASIPIKRRRFLYPKLAMWPTFGAIAVHMPFMLWYIRTPALRSIADIWFGAARASGVAAPLVMGGPMLLMLALPLVNVFERRLFGPAEGDDAVPIPEETPVEKASRRRGLAWSIPPLAIGLGLIWGQKWLPSTHPARPFIFPAALLLIVFGPDLLRKRFAPDAEMMGNRRADADLTARAKRLAGERSAAVRSVEVVGSAFGRRNVFAAAAMGGRITISQRTLDVMEPAEVDFLLAHEAAHEAANHAVKMLAMALATFALTFGPIIALMLRRSKPLNPSVLPLLMLLPMAGLGIQFFALRRMMRRREFESDRRALKATRDLAAAESALVKLARYSEMPHIHEVEDLATHPAMSKRLAALRDAAHEMGLPDACRPIG
jgi:Zn-dependent protease with chaperone function